MSIQSSPLLYQSQLKCFTCGVSRTVNILIFCTIGKNFSRSDKKFRDVSGSSKVLDAASLTIALFRMARLQRGRFDI
ncbi:uncharacterized protein Dvar_82220 [Desulfosarcina variabilis str. Montpellier]